MPRIAIAGFQHETNSIGVGQAGLAEFEMADSWPRLLTGDEVIAETRGMNLPIAGFAAAAQDVDLVPILWCAAEPSSPVTDHAFDTISERILNGLRNAGPLDAIFLDLHGAMITQSHDDGEAELLIRIRDVVGHDLPIAVSLDMHANVSERLVALSDVFCIYKTYPHLDMAHTGARAWGRLQPMLQGARPRKAFRPVPFLIPLHAQNTGVEPARGLYSALTDTDEAQVEMALGFTAGDTPYTRPAIIAYAPTEVLANDLADAALARVCAAEPAFDTHLATPDDAVTAAMLEKGAKPVVLADVQDNPGAGASSDTTGILRALAKVGVKGAMIGLIHDPDFAANAHHAGVGADISAPLGGRSRLAADTPFEGTFKVTALSDTPVSYTGQMYGGGVATMGPSCAVKLVNGTSDIEIVVVSIRNQCLDLAQFRHFGLEPSQAKIVVVKSTAHFRADFEPIAAKVINVGSPGLFPCQPPYTSRPGV